MHSVIRGMLADYSCTDGDDYLRALTEILHDVLLLGFREAGLLERAAICGGTALRVLHGLDRRSDGLEFCLLNPDSTFSLMEYADGMKEQLSRFGFQGELRRGSEGGAVLHGTYRGFMEAIDAPETVAKGFHPRKNMKIPVDVNRAPEKGLVMEQRFLQRPVPFPVHAVSLPDALAWNIHSLLSAGTGVDWFDFAWFVASFPEVRLSQLEEKLRNSGDYTEEAPLALDRVQFGLVNRIKALNIEAVKSEAAACADNPAGLDHWSGDYFIELVADLEAV